VYNDIAISAGILAKERLLKLGVASSLMCSGLYSQCLGSSQNIS